MKSRVPHGLLMLLTPIVATPCGAAVPISLLTAADYRLPTLVKPAAAPVHATSMLDGLFASPSGHGARRRSTSFVFGGATVTAEALRVRAVDTLTSLDGRSMMRERRFAGGVSAAWALGANDGLSLGIATSTSRSAEPDVLAGRRRIGGTTFDATIDWTHGANWRLGAGWQRDGGTTGVTVAERLVQIAQGAARHEQGLRLALVYALGGIATARGPSFGFEARDMRLAADDFATLGGNRRSDRRALAFARLRF